MMLPYLGSHALHKKVLRNAGKVLAIPIVFGALGSIPIDLPGYLKMIELLLYLPSTFQSTVLHKTTSILRRYLNV